MGCMTTTAQDRSKEGIEEGKSTSVKALFLGSTLKAKVYKSCDSTVVGGLTSQVLKSEIIISTTSKKKDWSKLFNLSAPLGPINKIKICQFH